MSVSNKRLIGMLTVFIVAVLAVAFLNYQMDDEIYIGFYDYIGYPDNASFENGVVTVDDATGLSAGDVIAETPTFHFDKGSFTIDADHQNDYDFEAIIYEKDRKIDRFTLPASEINTKYHFSSDVNLYNLKIDYTYNGKGTVTVKKSIIYSDNGAFYSDTIFYAILMIIIACIIVFTMIKIDFFNLPFKEKLFYGLLFTFLIISNYPFFRPFDTVGRGDKGYHMAQAEGIYRGFINGQIPPVYYPGVMHGRGMVGALYPHLLYWIPAFFRILHVSMEGSFRVFLIIINILTCTTSYYSAKIITKDKYLSLLSMILFFMLPYRLSAITLRSAYGEAMAFVFVPLLFAGMYEIILGEKCHWPILGIGLSGIIVTHLGTALQMTEVCLIIAAIYLYKLIKDHRLIYAIYAIISALLMDLWFIYSFLYYYNSDMDIAGQTMGDLPYITYYFSQMMQLLPNTTPGKQYNHQVETIGIWLIVAVIVSVYIQLSKEKRDKRDNLSVVFLTLGLAFIFAASKAFPWSTLSKFRLIYSFATLMEFNARYYLMGQSLLLFGSIMTFAGWSPSSLRIKKSFFFMILTIAVLQGYIIVDSYLITLTPFTDVRSYRYTPDIDDMLDYDFFAPYGYDHENFPTEASSPTATISDYWHRDSHSGFSYSSSGDTYVDLPLTYYYGFKAEIEDTRTELAVQKGDKGCIRIILPENTASCRVRVDFAGYPYDTTTFIISLLSIIGLISIICFNSKRISETRKGD